MPYAHGELYGALGPTCDSVDVIRDSIMPPPDLEIGELV